jgi:acyl carrier protein
MSHPVQSRSLPGVQSAIARHLEIPLGTVRSAHRLREDLGLDQLDLVLLAMKLEHRFHVDLPFYLMQRIETVETLSGWIDDLVRRVDAAHQRA